MGPFGPLHLELAEDWGGVVATLSRDQDGEVPGALFHTSTGPIDVIWGSPAENYGLGKLLERQRFDVVENLPVLLAQMQVIKEGPNRVRLSGGGYVAVVRKDFEGRDKNWLLTTFQKEEAPAVAEDGQATAVGRAGSPGGGDGNNIAVSDVFGQPADLPLLRDARDNASVADFDDPTGPAAAAQADHLLHDLRMDVETARAADDARQPCPRS